MLLNAWQNSLFKIFPGEGETTLPKEVDAVLTKVKELPIPVTGKMSHALLPEAVLRKSIQTLESKSLFLASTSGSRGHQCPHRWL